MKKIFKYILLVFSFPFIFNSCTEEFTPAFKENTSQRFQTAKSEYDAILRSAKNGWLLQYFPGKDLKYGGYNYYVNFSEENKVEVKTELYKSATVGEESTYAIKQYGGAVLSFDLYNPLMHFFATPSAAEYKGKGGDFEFQIISYKDNVMTLQGIKTGNYMKLIKMDETVQDYNLRLKNVAKYLNKLNYPLKGVVNNTDVTIDNPGGRNFSLVYGNGETQEEKEVSFVYTDKGIHFYEPLNINNVEYKELIFNKEGKKLSSKDGAIDINLSYILVNFEKTLWTLDVAIEKNRSDKIKLAWDGDNLIHGFVINKDYPLSTISDFGNLDGKVGLHSYVTNNGNSLLLASHQLIFKMDKNNERLIHIEKGVPLSFEVYYKYVNNLVDIIPQNSPYTLELDDEFNTTAVKLTSEKDPKVWFILNKK